MGNKRKNKNKQKKQKQQKQQASPDKEPVPAPQPDGFSPVQDFLVKNNISDINTFFKLTKSVDDKSTSSLQTKTNSISQALQQQNSLFNQEDDLSGLTDQQKKEKLHEILTKNKQSEELLQNDVIELKKVFKSHDIISKEALERGTEQREVLPNQLEYKQSQVNKEEIEKKQKIRMDQLEEQKKILLQQIIAEQNQRKHDREKINRQKKVLSQILAPRSLLDESCDIWNLRAYFNSPQLEYVQSEIAQSLIGLTEKEVREYVNGQAIRKWIGLPISRFILNKPFATKYLDSN